MRRPKPKGRFPKRHSVSTPIPPGWIDVDRLVAELKISKATLNNLRARYRYVFPEQPRTPPRAAGRGGTAYYPPATDMILRRLQELRSQKIRGADEIQWRLWLEGHPVDMKGWAADWLDMMKSALNEVHAAGITNDRLHAVAAALITLFGGRVRNAERVADLAEFALEAAEGEPAAADILEDSETGIFDTLRQGGDLPPKALPPSESELVELLSFERQIALVAEAKPAEIDRARRDFQAISRMVAAAERVDWDAVMRAVEPAVAKVTGARAPPKSVQARKAKRKKPPAILKLWRDQWRVFAFRATALAFLIGARRDDATSKRITEILDRAEWALSLFPRTVGAP